MNKLSRRTLAQWGAQQLLDGHSAKIVAKQLVAMLSESNRLNEANFLMEDIAWELENQKALAIGTAVSAHPLSSKLQSELQAYLMKATGAKQVLLENVIDESVVGGVRLETASQVWDTTVKQKLSELREVF
jgi:F-type H+-transporting ATPase subunit delta